MNIILIGNGVWGQKILHTLEYLSVNIKIANRDNWKTLIDQGAEGIIITTPPDSHVEIADYSLSQNIPTFIEKPLALTLDDALILSKYNDSIPILVNHVHLFSIDYERIKEELYKENIKNIISCGFNRGPYRDYSSLWDYGPHDLALILGLIKEFPIGINIKETVNSFGSLYTIEMKFKNTNSKSIVGNGGSSSKRNLKINLNNGKPVIHYDNKNLPIEDLPLTRSLKVFLNAINGKKDYRLGLNLALNVIKVLDICQNKLDQI